MMNVCVTAAAWLLAFDAFEFVTPKDALSNPAPIPFDCSRQSPSRFSISGSQALPRWRRAPLTDACPHQVWITEPVRKKEVLGQKEACGGLAHWQRVASRIRKIG